MRITGGLARGRKILSPGRDRPAGIRPTSDRVREALFNILGSTVRDARVLDLFAGTGSLGLEALSRGAAAAIFVDQSPTALEMISKNCLNIFPDAPNAVIRLDLRKKTSFSSLKKHPAALVPFHIVFLDPPYEKNLAEMALTMVDKKDLVNPGGTVVAEERWKTVLPEQIGNLHLHQQRRYGETTLWLYRHGRES